MNGSLASSEEAANIATEFIYSLENLPNEVRHILEEIRFKDARANDLQQQADRDGANYITTLRLTSATGSQMAGAPMTPKTASTVPNKIAAAYAEIHQLSTEKKALAGRMIKLLTRTRARLDMDLMKVRVLQGEVVEPLKPPTAEAMIADPTVGINESLRNALHIPAPVLIAAHSPAPPSTPASVSAPPPQKKRRITATPSIKLPAASSRSNSPAATAISTKSQPQQRSRLSRQAHPPAVPQAEEDEDEDAEGEEEEDGDDHRLYCVCQKESYGDMIACDNTQDCPYEWFHLSCVGMKLPTPDVWYCPACTGKASNMDAARKGRKK